MGYILCEDCILVGHVGFPGGADPLLLGIVIQTWAWEHIPLATVGRTSLTSAQGSDQMHFFSRPQHFVGMD